MRQISTVIEIGTSKIVCIMSQKGQFDESHILGSAVKSYAGYKNKKWLDKKGIAPAIIGAIRAAEQQAGKKCKYVHIGIPADFTKVVCSNESLEFSGYKTVTQADIEKLYKLAKQKVLDKEHTIIHVAPIGFKIDNARKTMEPVNQKANKLSATVSFIMVEKWLCAAISKMLESKGYTVGAFISSSYATSMKYISQQKRDTGAIMLDIGDKSTTVAIAKGDGLLFHQAISVGGANITNDIVSVLGLKQELAEELKKRSIYGLSLSKDDFYEVCDKKSCKFERYPARQVQNIIEARLYQILGVINNALEKSDCNIPDYVPIFVSGGTASMRGIREFIQKYTGRNTNLVQPQSTCFNQPAYASALSVTDMALDAQQEEKLSVFDSLKKLFDK